MMAVFDDDVFLRTHGNVFTQTQTYHIYTHNHTYIHKLSRIVSHRPISRRRCCYG